MRLGLSGQCRKKEEQMAMGGNYSSRAWSFRRVRLGEICILGIWVAGYIIPFSEGFCSVFAENLCSFSCSVLTTPFIPLRKRV